jgi:hypothetical protein
MRSLVNLGIGVITAIALAACTGDQAAPTAPTTTPNFKRLSAAKTYRFSFSCSDNVDLLASRVDMNVYHSDPPTTTENGVDYTALELFCGDHSDQVIVYSFDYDIRVRDATSGTTDCQTQRDGVPYTLYRTGTFTCKSETSSGSLTVTELST